MRRLFHIIDSSLFIKISIIAFLCWSYHSVFERPSDPNLEKVILKAATPWMGSPHRIGGEAKNGVDCSGLSRIIMKEAFELRLPRSAKNQSLSGVEINICDLRAGDLLFFTRKKNGQFINHVGIFLSGGRFLHSSSTFGVTISRMNENYWKERFTLAKRVIDDSGKVIQISP